MYNGSFYGVISEGFTGTVNLGTTNARWDTIYIKNLDMTGNLSLGSLTILNGGDIHLNGGDLYSTASTTYFYSTESGYSYQNIYANDFCYYDDGTFTSVKNEIKTLKQAIAALK